MVLRGFKYLFDGGFLYIWGPSLHINLRSGKLHKDLAMVLLFLRYMFVLAFLFGGNAQLLLTSRYPEYTKKVQGAVLLLCCFITMGHGNQSNGTSWVAFQVFWRNKSFRTI